MKPSEEMKREMAAAAVSGTADRIGLSRGLLDLRGYRAALGPTTYQLPAGVEVIDSSRAPVPGLWIVPESVTQAERLLYLHGGGYVAGSSRSHLNIAAWLARECGCLAFVPDYRLAPEHRYPAALEDALRCAEWLEQHDVAGVAPTQGLLLAGDSAGAGLAVALMQMRRDTAARMPVAAALLSPFVNLDPSTSARVASSGFERDLSAAYCGGADPRNPLISPVFADTRGLSPVLVQVSHTDPLAADAIEFVHRGRAQGADIHLDQWGDLPHTWHKFVPSAPESVEALRRAASFMTQRCLKGPDEPKKRMTA